MSEYIFNTRIQCRINPPNPNGYSSEYTNYIIKIDKNNNLFIDKQYQTSGCHSGGGFTDYGSINPFLNSSNFNNYKFYDADIKELSEFLGGKQDMLSRHFEQFLIQKIHNMEENNRLKEENNRLKEENNRLIEDNYLYKKRIMFRDNKKD